MKPWYRSRVLWFNVTSLAVAVASGQLGFEIPPSVAVPVLTIGNAVLRVLTSQPIG